MPMAASSRPMARPVRRASSAEPAAPRARLPGKGVVPAMANSVPPSWSAPMISGGWPESAARRCSAAVSSRTCAGWLTLRWRKMVNPPTCCRRSRASTSGGTLCPMKLTISFWPMACSMVKDIAVVCLTLDGAAEPAHELALQGDEDDEDWDDGQNNPGRYRARVGGKGALQRHQADGQGHILARLQHQRRPEEVIPRVDEGEDRGGGQRRANDGQHHAPPDAQLVGAVNARGIDQIVWHGLEGLAQQEDVEDSGQAGEDQCEQGVVIVEDVDRQDEARDEGKLRRHDEGGQQQVENEVAH